MSPGMGGYSSIGGAVRKMWAEEGFRGFYKGLYPNLLKVSHPPHNLSPRILSPNTLSPPRLCFLVLTTGCSEYGGKLVKFRVCPRFVIGTLVYHAWALYGIVCILGTKN